MSGRMRVPSSTSGTTTPKSADNSRTVENLISNCARRLTGWQSWTARVPSLRSSATADAPTSIGNTNHSPQKISRINSVAEFLWKEPNFRVAKTPRWSTSSAKAMTNWDCCNMISFRHNATRGCHARIAERNLSQTSPRVSGSTMAAPDHCKSCARKNSQRAKKNPPRLYPPSTHTNTPIPNSSSPKSPDTRMSIPAGTSTVNQNAAATCRNSSTVHSPPENTTSPNMPTPVNKSSKLRSRPSTLSRKRPQAAQTIPTMRKETASTIILVSQIFCRETGWASRLEKVPVPISPPKEASPSITAIAPHNPKAMMNHHEP